MRLISAGLIIISLNACASSAPSSVEHIDFVGRNDPLSERFALLSMANPPVVAPLPGVAAPVYPAELLKTEQRGSLAVSCEIDIAGSPHDCIIGIPGIPSTNPAFDLAALQYARSTRYAADASHSAISGKRYNLSLISFGPGQGAEAAERIIQVRQGRPNYPVAMMEKGQSAHVAFDCTIGADGRPQDCVDDHSTGDKMFRDEFLRYVINGRYWAMTQSGIVITGEHHIFTLEYRTASSQ